MKPIFIAEIKTKSPHGFKSDHTFIELMELAITYGDWISVHTNALWGGDFESISFVRKYTDKPILAKGLHTTDNDIERALDHGADYVLLVDPIHFPGFGQRQWLFNKCLYEINDIDFIKKEVPLYHELKNQKFVYNSRDLRTGEPKKSNKIDVFFDAGLWTCQASNIRVLSDVNPRVNAFIVGEHLPDFCARLPISYDGGKVPSIIKNTFVIQ